MENRYMRRFGLLLVCLLGFLSITALADTYVLNDGTKIDGDPISITDKGVVFHSVDGSDLPRVSWDDFSQDAIKTLIPHVKSANERTLVEQLVDEPKQEKEAAKEIVVKPIQPPPRPKTDIGLLALFGSPVGLTILFILYCTNIYAAYEVAIYRRRPLAMVCGLAAIPFLGVFSPITFVAMPTVKGEIEAEMDQAQTRFRETAPPVEAVMAPPPEDVPSAAAEAEAAPVAAAPAVASTLPPPVIFKRGEFSFNRRFFETRLAGFFRLVPGEAEKDMVVFIKSARGDFIGRRITRITPTELYLQLFNGNATADEMIPFIEVLEVQVRHKDLT